MAGSEYGSQVIGENSEQLGVMTTLDAMKRAADVGFDLVEVAPTSTPPVCRIMDYSRYKYEQRSGRKRLVRSRKSSTSKK